MHPAGRIAFVSKDNIHIWANGATRQLTNDGASHQPSWSPDGLFVAHVKVQNSSSDIWVMEAAGPKLWRLTYLRSAAARESSLGVPAALLAERRSAAFPSPTTGPTT